MPAADAAATGAAVLRSGPGTNPELERPHASNAPATTQAVTFLVERAIRKRARGEALGQKYAQSQKCFAVSTCGVWSRVILHLRHQYHNSKPGSQGLCKSKPKKLMWLQTCTRASIAATTFKTFHEERAMIPRDDSKGCTAGNSQWSLRTPAK